MRFRQESKYGLIGLLYLVQQPPTRVVGLREIADRCGLPSSFLAKIFPKFVQHGLVRAYRGATRGYTLGRPADEIVLREILEAIEGPFVTRQCFFGGGECDVTNPCPMHCEWRDVRTRIARILERTTLASLHEKDQAIRALGEATAEGGTHGDGHGRRGSVRA